VLEEDGTAVRLDPDAPCPSIVELSTHLREDVMATHIQCAGELSTGRPATHDEIARPGVKALFEAADALLRA
jgi:hypothetical protein